MAPNSSPNTNSWPKNCVWCGDIIVTNLKRYCSSKCAFDAAYFHIFEEDIEWT